MDSVTIRGVRAVGLEKALRRSYWTSLRRFQVLTYALIVAAPVAPMLYLSSELDPGLAQVAIATTLMGLPWFLLIWVQNAAWTSYLRDTEKTPTGAEADDWRFDAAGVQTTSPFMQWTVAWRGFVDVQEQPTLIHFILTPSLVMVLPKRFVTEEELAKIRLLIDAARARGEVKGLPK